jgi:hypothetical protein
MLPQRSIQLGTRPGTFGHWPTLKSSRSSRRRRSHSLPDIIRHMSFLPSRGSCDQSPFRLEVSCKILCDYLRFGSIMDRIIRSRMRYRAVYPPSALMCGLKSFLRYVPIKPQLLFLPLLITADHCSSPITPCECLWPHHSTSTRDRQSTSSGSHLPAHCSQ